MKSVKRLIGTILTALLVIAQIVQPGTVANAASTRKFVFEGIQFTIPSYWKYSDSNSTDTSKYFYSGDTGDLPMLYMTAMDNQGIVVLTKEIEDAILEGMTESLGGYSYGQEDVTIAGYDAFWAYVDGDIGSISANLRVLIINNTDKNELVAVMVGVDSDGDDDNFEPFLDFESYVKKSVASDDDNTTPNELDEYEEETAKKKTTKKKLKKKSKKKKTSIWSEKKFERALEEGKDMTGKKVKIKVTAVKPQSAFGYNLWAGKHLNFVSSRNPHVKKGQTITVKVTDVESVLGSWIISYKKV